MKQKSAACIVSLEFHIRIVIKKVGFNFNVKTRYLRVFDDHFFFCLSSCVVASNKHGLYCSFVRRA